MVEPQSQKPVRRFKAHEGGVSCLAFSHDGKFLASGGLDGVVRLWTENQVEEAVVLSGHSDTISLLSFSSDDSTLASSSWDKTVRLWDVSLGFEKSQITAQHAVNCVAFLPGYCPALRHIIDFGETLILGGSGGTLCIFGIDAGEKCEQIAVGMPLMHFVLTPSGRTAFIACLGQRSVNPDVLTWNPTGNLDFSGTEIDDAMQEMLLAEKPTGTLAPNTYGWLQPWSLETGEMICDTPPEVIGIVHIALSPDGQYVAVCTNRGEIRVWDIVARFTIRCEWFAHPYHGYEGSKHTYEGTIWSIAFSPDSEMLAAANADGTVRLWNPATGEFLFECRGHTGDVHDVIFSPDGGFLFSGGKDSSICVWEM